MWMPAWMSAVCRGGEVNMVDEAGRGDDAIRAGRRARLHEARLCVLIDGSESAEACGRQVATLAAAGVRFFQLRAKSLDDASLLARAIAAVKAARESGGLLVINDRVDIAVAADADGVHLGEHDLPPAAARQLLGTARLVGRTAHSLAEAAAARAAGADYLGVGPCFPSVTKTFAGFATPQFLASVARELPLPAFAIGGIDAARLPDVLATGLSRVAVASAVTAAADPAAAAAALLALLAEAGSQQ